MMLFKGGIYLTTVTWQHITGCSSICTSTIYLPTTTSLVTLGDQHYTDTSTLCSFCLCETWNLSTTNGSLSGVHLCPYKACYPNKCTTGSLYHRPFLGLRSQVGSWSCAILDNQLHHYPQITLIPRPEEEEEKGLLTKVLTYLWF